MLFRKKKKDQPFQVTPNDYEKLGRNFVGLYEAVNPKRGVVYRTAFLKGIATGVGGVLGATLVITILLWLLSLFDNIPLIGGFFESLRQTIDQ